LLSAVRKAGTDGLDGAQRFDVFDRHISRSRLDRAVRRLIDAGLAVMFTEPTEGRPREVLIASEHAGRNGPRT
jgi:hypothetical protein